MGSTARKIFVEPRREQADTSSNYIFTYDADAFVLEANITQPLMETLEQGFLTLAGDGAYQTLAVKPFQLGNILSHKGGYSQVGGYENSQGEYITFATAVIKGLNILETLSADRVVAQITTTMTPGESVQSVSFTGASIENLKINGVLVPVSVNSSALGPKPANGGSYFDSGNVPAGMAVSGDQLSGSILTPTSTPEVPQPTFGTVSLGKLTVTRTIPQGQTGYVYDYRVDMIMVDLHGGGAEGCVKVGMADPNGGGGGTTP
jgi:hypothetical protein